VILHLLRHAEAEDFRTHDADRALTNRGVLQATRMGEFLARHHIPLHLIVSSPYIRARETARAICKYYLNTPLVEDRKLSSGMSPEEGIDVLRSLAVHDHVLLVGHEPDLGFLAATLLSGDRSLQIYFDKATLVSIDLQTLRPASGILQAIVPVHLI